MKDDIAAPGTAVLAVTALVLVIGAVVIVAFLLNPDQPLLLFAPGILLVITLWAFLRAPVRYELRGDTLVVKLRVGAKTFGPVVRCEVLGEPVRFGLRLWGNGGLFAVTGYHWNKQFGRFQAYLTRLKPLVLITTADGVKVLISPRNAEAWDAIPIACGAIDH